MSPMPQPRGGKISPPSNLYTAILAVAVGVLLATIGVRNLRLPQPLRNDFWHAVVEFP